MFTGIVEARAAVLRVEARGTGLCLAIASPAPDWTARPGDSIAVSGVCLTVSSESLGGGELLFELSRETLERSWLGELEPGRIVNLERSLRMGDRLGGHLVSGHVDGVGTIDAIADVGDGGRVCRFSVPPDLERYLIGKGSITVDGISLTVVDPQGPSFTVAVIPETLERTSLGLAQVGQRVNLEADLVGKWIEKLLPG